MASIWVFIIIILQSALLKIIFQNLRIFIFKHCLYILDFFSNYINDYILFSQRCKQWMNHGTFNTLYKSIKCFQVLVLKMNWDTFFMWFLYFQIFFYWILMNLFKFSEVISPLSWFYNAFGKCHKILNCINSGVFADYESL